MRVDDSQVLLDQPEHVEVLREARRAVEAGERLGHPPRHRRRLQPRRRHRLAGDERQHHHVQLGDVFQDRRTDPGAGRSPGVVDLIGAVDREQLGRGAGEPHDVSLAAGQDQVVLVGQSARQRRELDVLASPEAHAAGRLLSSRQVLHRGQPVAHASARRRLRPRPARAARRRPPRRAHPVRARSGGSCRRYSARP